MHSAVIADSSCDTAVDSDWAGFVVAAAEQSDCDSCYWIPLPADFRTTYLFVERKQWLAAEADDDSDVLPLWHSDDDLLPSCLP